MSDVKVFKMINGEEIIAEVVKENVSYFELKNPANIMLQQTGNGQMGVGIAPYMPYATGNVKLYVGAIASEAEPERSMINEYNRIFGSGIEVVSASALAGLK
jgi:hypothetical protein